MVCVKPVRQGPLRVMQRTAWKMSRGKPSIQWKLPLAAAPHSTPHTTGIHVPGLVSCTITFHLGSSSVASV